MIEYRKSLYGLKDLTFSFVDTSDRANNTFHIYDFPETFYLGKNQFKIYADKNLVDGSQIYIDIIDASGKSVYYKVSNLISPDRTRTAIVHIYDTTSIGECKVYIAGRLSVNPLTGEKLPYSESPSSIDYKDNPNVLWVGNVNVSLTENVTDIIFDTLPTVTYSEKRIPITTAIQNNRFISVSGSVGDKISMQSTFDSFDVNGLDSDRVREGLIVDNFPIIESGSVKVIPVGRLPLTTNYSIIRSTNFEFSSSMNGGKIEVNNINYTPPRDASDTTIFERLDYSGSIVSVVNKHTIKVYPPLNESWKYVDTNGQYRQYVVNRFLNQTNFTVSYAEATTFATSSTDYKTYLNLKIENAEPEYGSVKSIQVQYKEIGTFGQLLDAGFYAIECPNLLRVSDRYEFDSKTGIRELDMGSFKDPIDMASYWSGSCSFDESSVYIGTVRTAGHLIDSSNVTFDFAVFNPNDYYKVELVENIPSIPKNTEYVFEFDISFRDDFTPTIQPQVDIYVSGSATFESLELTDNINLPQVSDKYKFGTYLGSVNIESGKVQHKKYYFKTIKDGNIVPLFIIRSITIDIANISISPRNEVGYSPNYFESNINLPDLNSSSELLLDIKYLNSKNHPSDYSSKLYGVEFTGNSTASFALPSGLISSSQQVNSGSFSGSFYGNGSNLTNILSSSYSDTASFSPNAIYSASNARLSSLYSSGGITGSGLLIGWPTGSNTALVTLRGTTTGSTTFPLEVQNSGSTKLVRIVDDNAMHVGVQNSLSAAARLQIDLDATKSQFRILNSTGGQVFLCRQDGLFEVGANSAGFIVGAGTLDGNVNGQFLRINPPAAAGTSDNTSDIGQITLNGRLGSATSGYSNLVCINSFGNAFTPITGNRQVRCLLINPVYSQSAAATGNITGILYSPTVQSVLGSHYGIILNAPNLKNGFGKASPNYMLDVSGTINIDGNLFVTSSNSTVKFGNKVSIGQINATSSLDISGSGFSQLRLQSQFTPSATADTSGSIGDWAWDRNYVYVKTDAGWKRSALSTF